MKGLDPNWITHGLIDFEYKKYVLLGFLNEVKSEYRSTRLYPALSEVMLHYRNLVHIRENKDNFEKQLPMRVAGIDTEEMKLNLEPTIEEAAIIQEIEDIISYSLPMLEKYVEEGKSIFEWVESKLALTHIGLSPLNHDEGYLLVHVSGAGRTSVYEYRITLFEQANEKYRGIHLSLLEEMEKSVFHTFEQIKLRLIRERSKLPNPATYLLETPLEYPQDHTLIPIAKRMLVRQVSQWAA